MRGFFIFGIIVNHLGLFPNVFAFVTGATRLWVSFAEGFFILSGFFVGFLYRNKVKSAFGEVLRKLSSRALRLYLWTVYLSLFFTYWGNWMPIGSVKEGLWIIHPDNLMELLRKAITLRYTYGWADILPYYAAFLLASPLYLYLLSVRLAVPLFCLNILIWLYRGDNSYMAIQILFFMGVIAGYYGERIKAWWQKRRLVWRYKFRTIIYGIFLLSLAVSLISVFGFESMVSGHTMSGYLVAKNRVLNWYFDKQTVGLGRWLLSPFWILALYFGFSSFIRPVRKWVGWIFSVFGKNSLRAYIVHAFVIYPIPFLYSMVQNPSVFINSLITFLTVIMIFLITDLFVYFNRFRA